MAEAEVAEEEKKQIDQFEYQLVESMTIDEVENAMKMWRKRSNKHEKGDWVMACPEPLKKKQAQQTYAWIAHPERPGKGGPEVACRAAYVALMQGCLFNIQGDFSSKSAERKEALEKDPAEWPVLKFKNGMDQPHKPKDDESDDEEETIYYGTPVMFAVRYKDNIYTANTLSDGPSLSPNIRMQWSGVKKPLESAFGLQAKYHMDVMYEYDLADGKKIFLDRARKIKKDLA